MPCTLSARLIVLDDGGLYSRDIARPEAIRPLYSRTCAEIGTVAEFKATLRAGALAWPGCYPLYFVTADGAALSFESAREQFREIVAAIRADDSRGGWRVIGCAVNWEDDSLTCDHSGDRIPSAYGAAE